MTLPPGHSQPPPASPPAVPLSPSPLGRPPAHLLRAALPLAPLPLPHEARQVGKAQRPRLPPKLGHHRASAAAERVEAVAVLQQARHGAGKQVAYRLCARLALLR